MATLFSAVSSLLPFRSRAKTPIYRIDRSANTWRVVKIDAPKDWRPTTLKEIPPTGILAQGIKFKSAFALALKTNEAQDFTGYWALVVEIGGGYGVARIKCSSTPRNPLARPSTGKNMSYEEACALVAAENNVQILRCNVAKWAVVVPPVIDVA